MPEQKNPSNPAGPRGVVPYNPGLYALVEAKNRWQDRSAESKHWNQRGYLPHRDAPGLTQFVTFRLADSFPPRCDPNGKPCSRSRTTGRGRSNGRRIWTKAGARAI